MSQIRKILKKQDFYKKISTMFMSYLKHYGYTEKDVMMFLNKHAFSKDDVFMRDFQKYFKIELPKSENAYKKISKNLRYTISYFKGAKTILDYGGSNGYMGAALGKTLRIDKKNNYVVDIPEWSGKKIVPRQDITFVPLNKANEANIKTNSIDVITAWHVLHHIKDIKLAIKFIKRVLKPGGVFIIKEHDIRTEDEFKFVNLEHMMFAVGFRGLSMQDFNNVYFKGRKQEELDALIGMKKIFTKYVPHTRDYSYYAVYKFTSNGR